MNRVVTGATIGSGVLVTWGWNTSFPEAQMPAEVGAVVGAVLQPLFSVVSAASNAVVARLNRWAGGETKTAKQES